VSAPRWPTLLLFLSACADARDDACWVADRAADRVILLGAELLSVTSVTVESPRLVVVDEHSLWIAHGPDGASDRPSRLSRLTHDLALQPVRAFDSIRDLCVHPDGGVAVVEQRSSGEGALWRVEPRGDSRVDLELPGLALVAADREHLLVALEDGGLVLLRGDGAVLAWTALDGAARALCAGSVTGTWWVLWGERDERLSCFGPAFTRLAELPAPEGTSSIAQGAEGVLVASPGGALLLGRDGELRHHREELAPGDEPAGIAALGPGVLWLLPGAVVRSRQGGFAALAGLAPTRLSAWSARGATPRRSSPRRPRRRPARCAGCGPCWP
jgi:hypothetical protein